MKKRFFACLALTIFFSVPMLTDAKIRKVELKETETIFLQMTPKGGLYIASQPSVKDLAKLKEMGVKTVVNLRSSEEMSIPEKKIVEKHHMEYHQVPVAPKTLSFETIEKFSEILSNSEKYPIFVHCSSTNRAAMMVALESILFQNQPLESTLDLAAEYGLTKPVLKDKVRELVKNKKGGQK